MNKKITQTTFIASIIISLLASSCDNNCEFDINMVHDIIISEKLLGDAAIDLATADLSDALNDIYSIRVKLKANADLAELSPNSILVFEGYNDLCLQNLLDKSKVKSSTISEEGFIIKTIYYDKKPLVLIAGNGIRGTCYGIFHLIERLKIDRAFASSKINIIKQPDMSFRMITQPFEAPGFTDVAKLKKPITQYLKREFDPMRPWEGAGYDPEDEARNILRSGLNAMWVGNFAFATSYDDYDPNIFPEKSEAGKWVRERRKKIELLIEAADKYHLFTIASSDIFAFPKGSDPEKKWDMLDYSLNEFLTDFPQIDWISTRFGENYSYYNNYFAGEGLHSEEEIAEVINFIYPIVCEKYDKKYMPRTWALGNKNWGADADLYASVVDRIEGTENIVFSAKNTRTDFWRYNIFNPVIGIGEKEQAIEFLCQDGYHFKSSIPYYDVIRMANGPTEFGGDGGMKKGYVLGVRTVWGWLTADGWCGPYIEREEWLGANIYGFSHLAWDVNSDPKILAKEWAAIEFGVEATDEVAEKIVEILMLSEAMILKSRYFQTHSKEHEGWTPSSNWIRDELIGGGQHSTNALSVGKSYSPGTIKPIFNPATKDADIADKKEAADLMNKMLANFGAIKESIPDKEQANELYNTLLYGKYLVYSLRYYVSGMFRFYNGEFDEAAENLRDWKLCWNFYNEIIPRLSGTASLMLDGGMVKTCDEAMKSMGESYDIGEYPDRMYDYETDNKAVKMTIGLPSSFAPEEKYILTLDISHMDSSVDNIRNLKLTFTSSTDDEKSIAFQDTLSDMDIPVLLQGIWISLSKETVYKVKLSFDYNIEEKSYSEIEIIQL